MGPAVYDEKHNVCDTKVLSKSNHDEVLYIYSLRMIIRLRIRHKFKFVKTPSFYSARRHCRLRYFYFTSQRSAEIDFFPPCRA